MLIILLLLGAAFGYFWKSGKFSTVSKSPQRTFRSQAGGPNAGSPNCPPGAYYRKTGGSTAWNDDEPDRSFAALIGQRIRVEEAWFSPYQKHKTLAGTDIELPLPAEGFIFVRLAETNPAIRSLGFSVAVLDSCAFLGAAGRYVFH
jgi:hypothetical protein